MFIRKSQLSWNFVTISPPVILNHHCYGILWKSDQMWCLIMSRRDLSCLFPNRWSVVIVIDFGVIWYYKLRPGKCLWAGWVKTWGIWESNTFPLMFVAEMECLIKHLIVKSKEKQVSILLALLRPITAVWIPCNQTVV